MTVIYLINHSPSKLFNEVSIFRKLIPYKLYALCSTPHALHPLMPLTPILCPMLFARYNHFLRSRQILRCIDIKK